MATEKRLIWGDIAESQLKKLADHYHGSFSGDAFERAMQLIAELPSVDAVEVVRCKDCKHYSRNEMFGVGYCYGAEKKLDDFCSYGERKDNA